MLKSRTIIAISALAVAAVALTVVRSFSLEPTTGSSAATSKAPQPRIDGPASMRSLLYVDPGKAAPDEINMIVEVPRGSQNKYEFDVELGVIKLDRVLHSPFHYPGDYGFMPRTVNADGDPLDVMVLLTAPTYPGTLVAVRPIGVLEKVDAGDQDDLILAVPLKDPRFAKVRDIGDVAEPVRKEIAHFFSVYKTLEGKQVSVSGWHGAAQAKATITRAAAAFQKLKP